MNGNLGGGEKGLELKVKSLALPYELRCSIIIAAIATELMDG